MSLAQNGFAFFSHDHGIITPEGPFETPIVTGQFFGVLGESHIIGETFGRNISCDYIMRGYASHGALATDLATLAAYQGNLVGNLTMTISANTTTFPKCTFLGVVHSPRGAFLDGSGVHGWVLFARLLWRQRSRA